MVYEIRNKKLYNKDSGKLVLVQVGSEFFTMKLERSLKDMHELNGILENNDVYLLKKGD